MSIHVLTPGLLSTVQDAGRPGHADIGMGRAGAADAVAWRLANALVGNHAGEAALEFTLAGPSLRFEQAVTIALTGALPDAQADGQPLPGWTSCHLPAGSTLRLGPLRQGCRGYLAVRGGIDAAPVLGSRSTDLHAALGGHHGRALRGGDRLAIGPCEPAAWWPRHAGIVALRWRLDPRPWFDAVATEAAPCVLALLPGTHANALDEDASARLFAQTFRLSSAGDRTGCRLDGHALSLRAPLELVSEPALPGTVQLPPSGQPIVLMAEAPVTGGYPRIGQLAAVELPRLAQRRPGDALCFRPCTHQQALARLDARERRLRRVLDAVARRLANEAREGGT